MSKQKLAVRGGARECSVYVEYRLEGDAGTSTHRPSVPGDPELLPGKVRVNISSVSATLSTPLSWDYLQNLQKS